MKPTKVMAFYLNTGKDVVYKFSFSALMLKIVREVKNRGVVNECLSQIDVYRETSEEFGDATILIYPDTRRLINELDYHFTMSKLAVLILMKFPGSPFIYNGEELGYKADWPLSRLPMIWDDPGNDPG